MQELAREIIDTIEYFRQRAPRELDKASGQMISSLILWSWYGNCNIEVPIPDLSFDQPAANFEKKYGINNIARHYVLPRNITPAELQTFAKLTDLRGDFSPRQRLQKCQELWQTLVHDNPDLKMLSFDTTNPHAFYFAIMGVASAFNILDIQFFISNGRNYAERERQQETHLAELRRTFNTHALQQGDFASLDIDQQLDWVAAPETLKNIRDQIAAKTQPVASAPLSEYIFIIK